MVKSMVKKQLWIPYFSPGQIYEKKSNQYHAKQIYKNWQWCIPYFIFSNMVKKMQNTAVVIQSPRFSEAIWERKGITWSSESKIREGKGKGN
jgi:hypothetical protein